MGKGEEWEKPGLKPDFYLSTFKKILSVGVLKNSENFINKEAYGNSCR